MHTASGPGRTLRGGLCRPARPAETPTLAVRTSRLPGPPNSQHPTDETPRLTQRGAVYFGATRRTGRSGITTGGESARWRTSRKGQHGVEREGDLPRDVLVRVFLPVQLLLRARRRLRPVPRHARLQHHRGRRGKAPTSAAWLSRLSPTRRRCMTEGNWRVGVLVDDKASDEQADKLVGVFSGAARRTDGGAGAADR